MKRQSLSLAAYLAMTRSAAQRPLPDYPARQGPVVWLHAAAPQDVAAIRSFLCRLLPQGDDIQAVVTGVAPNLSDNMMTCVEAPGESQAEIMHFLSHWRPVFGVWNGTDMRPALLYRAAERGCRLVAVNLRDSAISASARGWRPDASHAILDVFETLHATDAAALARLQKLGLPGEKLHLSGSFRETPMPLPVDEDLLEDMATHLSARPVWLAARVDADEIEIVLQSHQRAGRLAHRLLLVLSPAPDVRVGDVEHMLRDHGLRWMRWNGHQMPEEATQVILSPDPELLGLWYRLSPVCFLGGSLSNGRGGTDPMEAAALGSAIIYGPNVGRHLGAYSLLAEAGGARIVRDADTLASAVQTIQAPDKSAAMAHAAWDVATSGAPLADTLVEQALDAIDLAGVV
ncbi:glycosyltransferase N-terminal domain-containing protein [Mesobacterium sp. TK19101]|uniref:3-deoxy-D-manno-octulosonic acid transferase n=1 Tax=Mesobacterium hydrothermale TaxID=3111907 RepID=A0ABU6HIA3_9RHOB|nr:glycosyltransferase N-terminal domain-containing protein [Mesobacterium sp. TK19101]MEC3860870.1 glycosyltransferase N-terminal domain-containing protein [Mesobacterium sp. TK19101]